MASDQVTLRMVVYIGCAVAMVFLLVTLLILQCVRYLRTERIAIHKHLCLCLLLAEAAVVGGLEQTEEPRACSVLAGVLHYLLLASFAWAFLDSFHLYTLLGDNEDSDRWRLRWYCCVAYGVPLVVVTVSALIDPASYGTEAYCWLRVDNYYVFSFGGPAIACALASVLFLCMTIGRICFQRHSSIPVKSKDQTKLTAVNVWSGEATVLLLTMCSTWTLLPLFLHDERPLTAYFFLGLNSLQGLLTFLFYCVNAGKVQNVEEPPGPDWLCVCLRHQTTRRRSLYSPAASGPHSMAITSRDKCKTCRESNWITLEDKSLIRGIFDNDPEARTRFPKNNKTVRRISKKDRRCRSRNCEEHPLQYLLHPTVDTQQPWRPPDQRTLCYYRRYPNTAPLQEPHYDPLDSQEHEARPIFSSLAAVLSGGGDSPCHVAYSGIHSPTDSDRSSSSFMAGRPSDTPPSSPGNDLTDSMPNLERRIEGVILPSSLTY